MELDRKGPPPIPAPPEEMRKDLDGSSLGSRVHFHAYISPFHHPVQVTNYDNFY